MGWNDHMDISSCDSCGDHTPLDELNEDSFCMECVERHADEHEAKRLIEHTKEEIEEANHCNEQFRQGRGK